MLTPQMNPTLPLMTKHLRTMTCRCRSGKVKRDSVKISLIAPFKILSFYSKCMERDLQLCPCGVRGGGPDGGLTMTGGGEQEQETEIWPGQLNSWIMLRPRARSLMKWLWKMFKCLLTIKLCMLCIFYCYINFLQEVHYNEQCKRLYSNL